MRDSISMVTNCDTEIIYLVCRMSTAPDTPLPGSEDQGGSTFSCCPKLCRCSTMPRQCKLCFFFSILCIIFDNLFSLPPGRSSDPGSHSRLFSPPTHYGPCLAFLSRQDFLSTLSSLVDSSLISLSAVDPSSFFFLQIISKISPRWDSNSSTNASSIRG